MEITSGRKCKNGNRILLCAGLLLIAAALALAFYNVLDARRAEQTVEQTLAALDEASGNIPEEPADVPEEGPEDPPEPPRPAYLDDPDMPMPTVEVDGNAYIGRLEIPALELELPVMSEWSYPRLRTAPCRYKGSAYLDDMIVAAHNYDSHFGRLHRLAPGDTVRFIDEAGNTFTYAVSQVEELPGTAIGEMEAGDWDLTLFTCTLGGRARVTVRCTRV